MKTHNVLVIESLDVDKVNDGYTISYEYVLNAKLNFMAENGRPNAVLKITTTAYNVYDELKGLQRLFQQFLNGQSQFDFQLYPNIAENEADMSNEINMIIVQLHEPLKSEVEKIFDLMNWKVPQNAIPV